jgi:hypothetical protein
VAEVEEAAPERQWLPSKVAATVAAITALGEVEGRLPKNMSLDPP